RTLAAVAAVAGDLRRLGHTRLADDMTEQARTLAAVAADLRRLGYTRLADDMTADPTGKRATR
ncbi:MAG: hypothetical protein GY929_19620, partial [Actinomycetia bacterium]|nr:hypothetical protein [Actinomycetes bacterium]